MDLLFMLLWGRSPQNAYLVPAVSYVQTSDEREIVRAAKRHASKTTRWMCSRNTRLFRCQRSVSVSVWDWCGHGLRFYVFKVDILRSNVSFCGGGGVTRKTRCFVEVLVWLLFSNTGIPEKASIRNIPCIHFNKSYITLSSIGASHQVFRSQIINIESQTKWLSPIFLLQILSYA